MALPCSSGHAHPALPMQHTALRVVALAAMCAIGFADMYSYSMPDSFLGQVLAAQNASSSSVMLALVSRRAAAAAVNVATCSKCHWKCNAAASIEGLIATISAVPKCAAHAV
jgi:hypothetical protein